MCRWKLVLDNCLSWLVLVRLNEAEISEWKDTYLLVQLIWGFVYQLIRPACCKRTMTGKVLVTHSCIMYNKYHYILSPSWKLPKIDKRLRDQWHSIFSQYIIGPAHQSIWLRSFQCLFMGRLLQVRKETKIQALSNIGSNTHFYRIIS